MSLLRAISGYLNPAGRVAPSPSSEAPAQPHRFARTPQTEQLAEFLLRRLAGSR